MVRRVVTFRVAFVVSLFASCSGVTLESEPEAEAGADGTGGSSGTAPNGGVFTGGRGGTSTGARGGATAGGRGGTGGTRASGGSAGNPTGGVSGATRGGTGPGGLGPGGQGGEGGEGGSPDCDIGSLRLSGYRCESTESYAQGPGYERVEGASSLADCFEACRARPDCTAVADYFEMRPFRGCALDHDSCTTLTKDEVAEEDGARAHEKVCLQDVGCSFVEIPGNYACGSWFLEPLVAGATSLDDCKRLCLDDPACTAVQDYFYTVDVPGCYLVTTSCDEPVRNFQDGTLYPRCP